MPEQTFISIGSNVQPERHLVAAALRVAGIGRIRAVSCVYENPAVGSPGRPDFLNAAILLETDQTLADLVLELGGIEQSLGRVRTADKFAPRTIDLDVCLYGDLVEDGLGHVIPDPDILHRAYLAVTLAELDSDFRHPITDEALGDIATRLRPNADLRLRTDVRLVAGP